jgi:hypothetical protein
MRRPNLVKIANQHVPFPQAAMLVGVGSGSGRGRGDKVHCPFPMNHSDGGREDSLRVYPDHGWCFSELRYFTPVSLVAGVLETDFEEAARWLLDQVGYVPVTAAHLWEHSQRVTEPGIEELGEALKVWCAANCPDWQRLQYDMAVSDRLARCLGLLTAVRTPEDCVRWLDGCKRAMRQVLRLPE